MEIRKKKLTLYDIQFATGQSNQMAEKTQRRAEDYRADDKKKERLEKCECRTCFYINNYRIGGAAMTTAWCRICGAEMGFGSTSVDDLCLECAKEHRLCKVCSASIDGKKRRKFPVGDVS